MSDIVERLRGEARIFRKHDLPPAVKLLTCEAAAEIARLRAGGCARDQGTTQYCAEAAKLAVENEKLRAALESIVETTLAQPGLMVEKARAALEGKR